MRAWAIVFVGLAVLIAAFIVYYIRGMAELFAGFGADLPVLTRLFIDLGAWILLVPLSGLIPIVLLFAHDEMPEPRMRTLFGWTVAMPVISVGLFIAAMFAMYQPIFEMGSVV